MDTDLKPYRTYPYKATSKNIKFNRLFEEFMNLDKPKKLELKEKNGTAINRDK